MSACPSVLSFPLRLWPRQRDMGIEERAWPGEDRVVPGDNAASTAVPSLMTARVSLRETLGPKQLPGWTRHPDLPTAGPRALPAGATAGSARARSLTGGLRRTLLLAGGGARLIAGPAAELRELGDVEAHS